MKLPLPLGLTLLTAASLSHAADEASCRVRQAGPAPRVVELYTSEGCSSCPPAERWLNGLQGAKGSQARGDVLALAFHVTYWDYLGWTDRLATPEGTERQRRLAQLDGSGVYTPQVRVSGADWRRWPDLPAAASAPGPVVELARDGAGAYSVQVGGWTGGPLSGLWMVLEDGLQTQVRRGENAGATLHHQHVVRWMRPVPDWAASATHASRLTLPAGLPAGARRVVFMVSDARSQRPVQAAVLDC